MKTPTLKQKVDKYEKLLHSIQLNAEVILNENNMKRLISNICAWSYAHRRGNGEPTEKQQRDMINKTFWGLTNLD
jgi:hypothetical protein